MEGVNQFAGLLKRIIQGYADLGKPAHGDVEVETVFDDVRDHYELIYTGWDGWHRVHGTVIHADIIDGKIWIQHDGTEDGIAIDLLAAGVPRDRIVLAFLPPSRRKDTEFAVA